MWLLWLALASAGPAPSLAGAVWVSEGPVAASPGQLQVVEIWATWCGPCHATFPLLTRLQREHGDRLRVLALADDDPAAVRRAVERDGERMGFAVGVIDEDTARAFLFGGFGGRGIPSTYLVRDGAVLWGGPPEELAAAVAAHLPAREEE